MAGIEFGEWLQKTLDDKGVSQLELSKRCGCSQCMINNYCRSRRIPRPSFSEVIAYCLNLSMNEKEDMCDSIAETVRRRYKEQVMKCTEKH